MVGDFMSYPWSNTNGVFQWMPGGKDIACAGDGVIACSPWGFAVDSNEDIKFIGWIGIS